MNVWESYDLRQVIPDNGARKDYANYSVDRCPFHDDSRPSLIIWPRHWQCKAGCGSGDVVEWVCRTKGVGRRDALLLLREGIPDQTERRIPKPKIVPPREELDQSLGLRYHLQLQEREREWYRWRGLTDESINLHELGFGIPPGGRTGRFSIPIYEGGKLVNVRFRVDDRCPSCISPWTFKGDPEDDFVENEWFCADCRHRFILNGNKFFGVKNYNEPRLYGVETLAGARRAFIVEGELDRAIMVQNGYVAVSSTGGCGTFLSSWGVHFLHINRLYVVYDADNGGEEGMKKVQEVVPKARIVRLPLGAKGDISDFLNSHTKEEFEVLIREADRNCHYLAKASNGLLHGKL